MTAEAPKKKLIVPRITQLDSREYDGQIANIIKEKLFEVGQFLPPGVLTSIAPELELLTQLYLVRNSLWANNSTFGQELLNVKYSEKLATNQKILFALLNYVAPYVKNVYETPGRVSGNSKVGKWVDVVDTLVKVCQIANFFVFIHQGIYSNIVDRLLGLRMSPKTRLNRTLCYDLMWREFIWDSCMDILQFTLPLINIQYLRRKAVNLFKRSSQDSVEVENVQLRTNCVICGLWPTHPCRISKRCQHVACYYCIKSNILADAGYQCPECGTTNTACEELQFLYRYQTS